MKPNSLAQGSRRHWSSEGSKNRTMIWKVPKEYLQFWYGSGKLEYVVAGLKTNAFLHPWTIFHIRQQTLTWNEFFFPGKLQWSRFAMRQISPLHNVIQRRKTTACRSRCLLVGNLVTAYRRVEYKYPQQDCFQDGPHARSDGLKVRGWLFGNNVTRLLNTLHFRCLKTTRARITVILMQDSCRPMMTVFRYTSLRAEHTPPTSQ